MHTMYNLFPIVGSAISVFGLIFLRIKCSPALHPDAKLFIDLLSIICSEKEGITHERKNKSSFYLHS